jgi:hypothetical protein
LFSGISEKFGVWPREHPTGTVADINLVASCLCPESRPFVRWGFEIIRDDHQTLLKLTPHADAENEQECKRDSHANKFGTIARPRMMIIGAGIFDPAVPGS